MYRVLDDGRVAISFESRGGTIRALNALPDDDHPEYVAVGEVTKLNNTVAKLHAFSGVLTRQHLRLVVRLLLEEGYRVAYIDRVPGRKVPTAQQIKDGDWAGWWRLDLVSARLGGVTCRM